MCVHFLPMSAPPYDVVALPPESPLRRMYTPLQPPRPLPWYARDPLNALVVALAVTLGLLVFIKACELLGSF